MGFFDTREGRFIIAIGVQLTVLGFGKLARVVSLTQAIGLGGLLILLTLVVYTRPQILYRPWKATKALFRKQPDDKLAILGIQEGVSSARGSKYSPERCMERTDLNLDFMGMLGSKWVEKPDNYNKFNDLLEAVKENDGQVRFLLANWQSDGYETLLRRRNRRDMSLVRRADHYRDYLQLANEYDCLEVRLYSEVPTFRMVFIDNNELGVSRYRYSPPENDEFDRGRKIPHVVINKDADFSIYKPFEEIFEEIWDDSRQIENEDVPVVEDISE